MILAIAAPIIFFGFIGLLVVFLALAFLRALLFGGVTGVLVLIFFVVGGYDTVKHIVAHPDQCFDQQTNVWRQKTDPRDGLDCQRKVITIPDPYAGIKRHELTNEERQELIRRSDEQLAREADEKKRQQRLLDCRRGIGFNC